MGGKTIQGLSITSLRLLAAIACVMERTQFSLKKLDEGGGGANAAQPGKIHKITKKSQLSDKMVCFSLIRASCYFEAELPCKI